MYSGFCLFGWTEWCLCNAFNIPSFATKEKTPSKTDQKKIHQCHNVTMSPFTRTVPFRQWQRAKSGEVSTHPCSDRPDGKALQRAHMHGSAKELDLKKSVRYSVDVA